mmetsp:Transcript_82585/g.96572  ORF Transcript_82585/g.96572 Transcript_82585/m.96572 type:complete len:343 (-) Transcript_82585:37-1065(-)
MYTPVKKQQPAKPSYLLKNSNCKKSLNEHLYKGLFTANKPMSTDASSRPESPRLGKKPTNYLNDLMTTKVKSLELQILHEVAKGYPLAQLSGPATERGFSSYGMGSGRNSPGRNSPGRNPLLPYTNQESERCRSATRRHPESDRVAMFSETEKSRGRKRGVFNDTNRVPVHEDLSARGIRMVQVSPSRSVHELYKRQLRSVKSFTQNEFNPIVNGDPRADSPPRTRRTEQQVSSITHLLNEKKMHLPSERSNSPRRSPYRGGESTVGILLGGAIPLSTIPQFTESKELTAKKGGNIKALITYKDGPNFRSTGGAKINEVPYSTIKDNLKQERPFARRSPAWI